MTDSTQAFGDWTVYLSGEIHTDWREQIAEERLARPARRVRLAGDRPSRRATPPAITWASPSRATGATSAPRA